MYPWQISGVDSSEEIRCPTSRFRSPHPRGVLYLWSLKSTALQFEVRCSWLGKILHDLGLLPITMMFLWNLWISVFTTLRSSPKNIQCSGNPCCCDCDATHTILSTPKITNIQICQLMGHLDLYYIIWAMQKTWLFHVSIADYTTYNYVGLLSTIISFARIHQDPY